MLWYCYFSWRQLLYLQMMWLRLLTTGTLCLAYQRWLLASKYWEWKYLSLESGWKQYTSWKAGGKSTWDTRDAVWKTQWRTGAVAEGDSITINVLSPWYLACWIVYIHQAELPLRVLPHERTVHYHAVSPVLIIQWARYELCIVKVFTKAVGDAVTYVYRTGLHSVMIGAIAFNTEDCPLRLLDVYGRSDAVELWKWADPGWPA